MKIWIMLRERLEIAQTDPWTGVRLVGH